MQKFFLFGLLSVLFLTSCVSKKKFAGLQAELDAKQEAISKRDMELNRYAERLADCERKEANLQGQVQNAETQVRIREEQITDLKEQRDRPNRGSG